MTQVRLSALAMLSVECERAKKLDLSSVVEEFANKNAKRSERFHNYIICKPNSNVLLYISCFVFCFNEHKISFIQMNLVLSIFYKTLFSRFHQ